MKKVYRRGLWKEPRSLVSSITRRRKEEREWQHHIVTQRSGNPISSPKDRIPDPGQVER
jgi:hypothetical protein